VGCPTVFETAAAALLFNSSCILGEAGAGAMRVAECSFFAVVMAGFGFLLIKWAALS